MGAPTNYYCDYAAGNDYTGATFTDGSFANATLTLTKAGAFAASKVNHWLYLSDNGSGEVTAGYYRVTDASGAPNAVVLHADIRSGVNDPTDVVCTQATGAIGVPFRSVQGAFDLVTRDAVNGDQINIKAATTQTCAATLTWATYGSPDRGAPFVLRGYTSTAGDGGQTTIDGGGSAIINEGSKDYFVFADIRFTNAGANTMVNVRDYSHFYQCQFDTCTGNQMLQLRNFCLVERCYFTGSPAARLVYCMSGTVIRNSYFVVANSTSAVLMNASGQEFVFRNNIILLTNAGAVGVDTSGYSFTEHNIFYKSVASNANMYGLNTTENVVSAVNNIFVGFNGVGNEGINSTTYGPTVLGHNAFYNNTANYSLAEGPWIDLTANDVALLADPFTSAATGDFSLTEAAQAVLRSAGWPPSYLGAHANSDPHITIGPIQYGSGAGGGGFPKIASLLGRTRM